MEYESSFGQSNQDFSLDMPNFTFGRMQHDIYVMLSSVQKHHSASFFEKLWASMFGKESAEKVSEIVNKNIEQTNKKVKKNLDELTPRAVKLSTMSGVMHLLV